MIRRGVGPAASCILIVVALGLATPAAATDSGPRSKTVTPSRGSWYDETPPCVAAVDCSALPPVSPFPEDTLHVAISAGQETASTYIAFTFTVPAHGRVTGGTLKLPLDTDPAHGSISPDQADFIACATKEKFKNERGSFAKPPKADCSVKRKAVFDAKHSLFTVDLRGLVKAWTKKSAAVALLPSAKAEKSNATWRVVFPSPKKKQATSDKKSPPHISARLTFAYRSGSGGSGGGTTFGGGVPIPPPSSSGSSGSGSQTTIGSGSIGGGVPASGGGAPAGSSDVAQQAPQAVTTAQPAAQPLPPSALVGFAGPGFAYPLMWALPLVLLVGVIAVGRAMTKELYRRGL